MGKTTGFQEWKRVPASKREKAERLGDSREFILPLSAEEAKRQAGRCMDCGVPFCHQGCPLGNPIPEFNDAVYRGRWKEAFLALSDTNNFPEFTGRLCPAPCEAACVLGIDQDPVTIEQMEKEIIERAFAEGWVKARPPAVRTGRRVAVVGSGPAGLAAAAQLNQAGHSVTVFERDDKAGGLLRYGIPDFKLDKSVLDRRLQLMEAEGIEFRCGVNVGREPGYRALREQFDAVVLALGARRGRELDVPGRELDGVVLAMDYLEHQNRVVAGLASREPRLDAVGRRVLILGGGDTGSDCLGTALRQGAASVTQVELMPAPPSVRALDNPWPRWPLLLRTSSSQEEGGEREFGMMTRRLEGKDGKLQSLHTVRVEVQREPGGAPRLVELPGSERVHEVDLLVLAMGFTGPDTGALAEDLGVSSRLAAPCRWTRASPRRWTGCSARATPAGARASSSGPSRMAARRRSPWTRTWLAAAPHCPRAARTTPSGDPLLRGPIFSRGLGDKGFCRYCLTSRESAGRVSAVSARGPSSPGGALMSRASRECPNPSSRAGVCLHAPRGRIHEPQAACVVDRDCPVRRSGHRPGRAPSASHPRAGGLARGDHRDATGSGTDCGAGAASAHR